MKRLPKLSRLALRKRQGGFILLPHLRALAGHRWRPSLDLSLTGESMDSRLTYSGGSGGTYTAKDGTMRPQRGNGIRNSVLAGAVVGTPGTLPTNVSFGMAGLAFAVVAKGIDPTTGLNYVDVRCYGTASNTFGNLNFEAQNAIAAVNGQPWTVSAYFAVVGGSLAGVTASRLRIAQYSSVPAYLSELVTTPTDITASLSAIPQRFSTAGNANNASTAYISPYIQFTWLVGAAIDFTLRVIQVQLEPGLGATANVITSGSAIYLPRADNGSIRTNFVRNNTPSVGATASDGVERIVNGSFAGTAGAGWTVALHGGTGSVNFGVTGQATITGDGTHQTNLTQAITTVVGQTYSIQVTPNANVFVQVGNAEGSSAILGATVSAGWRTLQFVATATTTYVGFAVTNAVSVAVSAISVKHAGVLPTYWSLAKAAGLSFEVARLGTATDGTPYIDLRMFGTTTDASLVLNLSFDFSNVIQALSGQAWDISAYLALVAGAKPAGGYFRFTIGECDSGGISLAYNTGSDLTLTSALTRQDTTKTLSNAATAYVRPSLWVGPGVIGTVVDATIRIGLPQLERGTSATAVIPTTGTAVSVADAPLGSWGEKQRTNSVRNSACLGAVAGVVGSGGAMPTNWYINIQTTTGLTRNVLGVGVENGIPYVDVRISGTAVGNGFILFGVEGSAVVAAVSGQTWTLSSFLRLIAGSFNGIGTTAKVIRVDEYSAAAAYLTSHDIGMGAFPSGDALISQRFVSTVATNNASCAFVAPVAALFNIVGGATVDFTIRLGLPQLELGPCATSPIPTYGSAVTRTTDALSVVSPSISVNAAQGTLYWEGSIDYAPPAGTFPQLCALSDGTPNNYIAIDSNTFLNHRVNIKSGGVTSWDVNAGGTLTVGAISKVALSYSSALAAASANGITPATQASPTLPAGLDRITLGVVGASTNQVETCHVKRVKYYASALPSAKDQSITA